MRRMILASTAMMMAVLASGIVACTNIGVSTAGAAEHSSKSVKATFCSANDSIDRASANVNSDAAFLAVIKKHSHDLAVMKKNAPSGALGQTVKTLINAAEAAVSSNNTNALNNLPSGGSVDTYCGVDGSGNPLPTYFGKGTTTAFCSTFLPIYVAVGNAPDQAGVLAVLTAHQAQINQLASKLSSLPKSIKAKATATVDKAQKAISSKNPSAIGGGNGPAGYVALYCGQNQ
ncbi:MAG TPA: hypothetical protein VND70_10935 [Acidimicrobiales bacterium]|nr:hypothetical protein [Acidimicrobiales bacterium]